MIDIIVYIIAGIGAGVGTGLAGLSAAAVISPMLITFCGFDPYEAVAISLASDVLASALSAYTYGKNKNLDIRNGLIMLASVLVFTVVGSWVASLMPAAAMGSISVFMTFLLGIKFLVRPVMTTKEKREGLSRRYKIISSILCGSLIGFICGFVGAGGGMMLLLILTGVLGYELKTAVGTSVFIMAFTAFTGAASHIAVAGFPDVTALIICAAATLIGAQVSSRFANKASPEKLNRVTGAVLAVLGAAMIVLPRLA
ncbi:MAG: sulfite exporter TauE/SafE family protein [Oscillospiraceae bacterium]